MMTRDALAAALFSMEATLADTRRNIASVERRMRDHAEAETIRSRPKARHYHRRMSRWTGADEAEYRRILDALAGVMTAELAQLGRKAERQDRAIEVLRCKYGVNAPRPRISIY
ncbi:MAG TPA: hypothetical protein PKA13_12135 [Geminicoccaceae bacterium]|nr:hypothetical protein [Geminicoccaceae bacterium]